MVRRYFDGELDNQTNFNQVRAKAKEGVR
jgi:hypothetical protein